MRIKRNVRMEVSFWRHKSKRAGMAQLYCRITIGDIQKDICSTGITIHIDHWDGRRITHDDPNAHFKNERLGIIEDQLNATYNDLLRNKQTITADKIKRIYLNGTESVSILSAFEMYLKDSAIDTDRNLEGASLTVYDNVRKKLVNFLIDQKAVDLLVEDFDYEWLTRYRRWMKALPLDGGKVGHADSYVAKHSQTIRDVVRWAKRKKLCDVNPLDGLRIRQPDYGDPVFLTEEQFEQLRTHRFVSRLSQETADVLIILCRSGFHYTDLKDFVTRHKTTLRKGLDGKPWMMKNRIKTEVAIRVPVFDEVKTIVERYGGWEKLPIRPLSKFNPLLKLVAAELNLPEDLSSKAGRKTFTDWCFNTLGLSTDAILVLLGRKSAKGLEVYGRPDERRVIAELKESKALRKSAKKRKP